MSVRRIFVEKKPAYAVKAGELREELESYLGIDTVENVRVLIRYDIENLSEETYGKALVTIFSEPPVDEVYEEEFPKNPGDLVFSVEYLPGQFDQRADSAEQCVKLLKEDEEPVIRSATTYVITAVLTPEQEKAIKGFCINPVDSREAGEDKPSTLVAEFEVPEDIKNFEGFAAAPEAELKALYDTLNLAMTFKDFLHIQRYFRDEERRDPTVTEIRVLDTYWSDHCRHTTFSTELKNVRFTDGDYRKPIEDTYNRYLADREVIYKGRDDKYVCLMDLALMAMKKLKSEGKLEDMEISDEINACSIVVPVEIDGVTEEWLVNFKNETHNHPTEIEPFGGAATCLGGAIRDPLSGRTYVYQAMRVTGAADPTRPLSETLKGKLPQRKIVNGAAQGYSSYGNQIGLSTGYVKEIYHPGYVAKRMEIGAVMGAAPRKDVIRENSDPGDIIILLGGRTGRDGIGGATGSSKVHTTASIEVCGAEVQKGNAPTERKIQRMFRRPEVSRIIKKCNDFGAGGVSVAIGELAAGLQIDLDKVPKKYAGLDGTEIAISESQERMAVVVDPGDVDKFLAYAAEENLEAVTVAVVTEEPRLVLNWRGKTIVDISRAFLDTNGAHQEADVTLEVPGRENSPLKREEVSDVKTAWTNMLAGLNVCSQKGLVERFDGSIGAGSVFMPYGGKYQLTETQAMVAKLPVLKGSTDTVTMMSYGFDPYLSSWSPYHGAVYAVLTSVAKIVAAGGDYSKIRFTFQEYFRRMNENPERWSQPFAALLGAYSAQMGFGLPSIGGKDSMSGTFDDEHGEVNVPPTLVSFAVDVNSYKNIITPEFKKPGSKIVVFKAERDGYDLPVYGQVMDGYGKLFEDIKAGRIISAYAVEGHGMAEAVSKMAFGNKLGVKIEHSLDPRDFFAPGYGDIVCEVPDGLVGELSISYTVIGEVTDRAAFEYGSVSVSLDEALESWTKTLEDVFPTATGREKRGEEAALVERLYKTDAIYICDHKIGSPTVFIPVFPGTNCEYDSAKAFERAGARAVTRVFRNLSAEDIRQSVEVYRQEIAKAQIVMFPGGFSAGDEPEGSAKFFATVFRNAVMKEEIEKLLNERDGLILGVCNGFQALIKLGLVPGGEIADQGPDSPTLAMNTIGRHVSKMVYTKVVSDKSPWLAEARLGGVYCNPASHGEGRFVANEAWLSRLFANGQVATQYVDDQGNATMDEYWNPNGSYMAIEGITSPDGRILGKMAHSERRGQAVAMNIYGEQDMRIFESGVNYFKI
ncbi:phosphoribosylformylglycinamidine synthase [Enterocloster asparagiformis]|uniref:Phosphoribosylformylglycinamidine synthase n=5 Tax=Enterocloster asparagiformis TaxID=333367 RepID=C0D1E8_9FIRM|nr:phosphoribosylformylglycinamidine synthase [Enterocloster asparagiformis]EEG54843.1 phosphoribosylformylglycinamidine synthase [[Clostridium] asparagiforme DSM 15981]RGX32751.1 phosphoribosylformylglycinamidine synthase [Enterocloster asparagiformis]UWO79312.1 phosphoribosylformylglycinamidine synthase [[Clostridium] asparagiforme DSM 15981]